IPRGPEGGGHFRVEMNPHFTSYLGIDNSGLCWPQSRQRALLLCFQQEEMPWKAEVTSRFCSLQGLVQSFAKRAKVASCTEKCSVSRSKKKVTAIFIPKRFKAQKLLPCGRFLRRRSLVSAKIHGLTAFPSHRHGLSLMLIMSKRRLGSLNREDIECSSRTRKNRGGKRSLASSRQKDCWLVSLSLHWCGKRNSRVLKRDCCVLQLVPHLNPRAIDSTSSMFG